MKAKEIMTSKSLKYCWPLTMLKEAAKIMKGGNCGSLPVVDGEQRVLGMITDWDICLTLANNYTELHPQLLVKDIMAPHVQTVNIDDSLADVLRKMRSKKVGRLPVVDNDKRLQGIITIYDMLNETFSGKADLVDTLSSGESIYRTIKALNDRYWGNRKAEMVQK